jgi:hypothetical protein
MKECVMFCDHCGSPLHPTSKFCSACGKPVIPLPSLSPTLSRPVQSEDRVRRHINRLAILWLANGVLRLMLVLWFFGASRYSMPPVFGPARLWAQPFWHGHAWNSILLILALFGIGHLVLAWGLFERQPWARIFGLVLGILALLRIPLGTALGVYTLWVLAPETSAREYELLTQSAYLRQA